MKIFLSIAKKKIYQICLDQRLRDVKIVLRSAKMKIRLFVIRKSTLKKLLDWDTVVEVNVLDLIPQTPFDNKLERKPSLEEVKSVIMCLKNDDTLEIIKSVG